ncbi:MAG: iron-sulfur cluster repair di-iron protein [Planctomycetota bacterium]
MSADDAPIDATMSLAMLANAGTAAVRVFQRHGLDFCCHGQRTLVEACAQRHIDPAVVVAELRAAAARTGSEAERWDRRSLSELIDHLLTRYHARHRHDLPQLAAMAARVEQVHAGAPDCPHGLANLLQAAAADLERHMRKEEDILFPLLRCGHGRSAAGAIQVMEQEHLDHAAILDRLRRSTGGFTVPEGACATWRALYAGLEEHERDLMQHVHLENHVLFPRAMRE